MLQFLVENSLYADNNAKANLMNNKTIIMDSLMFNFFGFLGLFKISSTKTPMVNYGSNEARLTPQNISDKNLDVSLSIKLAYDVGLLTIDAVNRMTKLLALIKQKKISDSTLDENIVRTILDVIKYNTYRPSPMIFDAVQKFHNGQISIEKLSTILADLSIRKEFAGITTEFRKIVMNGGYRPLFSQYSKASPAAPAAASTATIAQKPIVHSPITAAPAPTVAPVKAMKPTAFSTPSALPAPTAGIHHPSTKLPITAQVIGVAPVVVVKPKITPDDVFNLFTANTSSQIDTILNKFGISIKDTTSHVLDLLQLSTDRALNGFLGTNMFLNKFAADTAVTNNQKVLVFSELITQIIEKSTSSDFSIVTILVIRNEYLIPYNIIPQINFTFNPSLEKIIKDWAGDPMLQSVQVSAKSLKEHWEGLAQMLSVCYDLPVEQVFSKARQLGHLKVPEIINPLFANLARIAPDWFSKIPVKGKNIIVVNTFSNLSNGKSTDSKFRISMADWPAADFVVKNSWTKLEEIGIAEKVSDSKVNDYISVFELMVPRLTQGYSFSSAANTADPTGTMIPKGLNENEMREISKQLEKIPEITRAIGYALSNLLTDVRRFPKGEQEILEFLQIVCMNITGLGAEKYLLEVILLDDLAAPELKKKLLAEIPVSIITNNLESIVLVRSTSSIKNGVKMIVDHLNTIDFTADYGFFSVLNSKERANEGYPLLLPSNEAQAGEFFKNFLTQFNNRKMGFRADFFEEFFKKFPGFKQVAADTVEVDFSIDPFTSRFSINHLLDEMITPTMLENFKTALFRQQTEGSARKVSLFSRYFPSNIDDILTSTKLKNTIKEVSSVLLIQQDFKFEEDFVLCNSIKAAVGPAATLFLQQFNSFNDIQTQKISKSFGWNRKAGSYNAPKIEPSALLISLRENEDFISTVKMPLLKKWFEQLHNEIGTAKDLFPKVERERMYKEMAEIIGALKEVGRENEIGNLFDSLLTPVKKQIIQHMLQYKFIDVAKDNLLNSEIKPLFSVDHKRMIEIFKYNSIDVPTIDLRKYKTYRDITQMGLSNKGLDDLAITTIKGDSAFLEKRSIEYDKFNRRKHGQIAIKFLKEFNVDLEIQRKGIMKFIDANPSTPIMDPVFHGTGSLGASMILRYGFKVIKSSDASVVGRMLGDGIYFSNVLDKVSQYVGDAGFTRKIGTKGYIFQCKAALGQEGKDYRSAGVNDASTRSPEWCVFKANEQLYIYKAFFIEIIPYSEMKALKSKYNIAEDKIMKIETFQEFLKEVREEDTYRNVTTYTFIDGRIPIDENAVVEFEDFDPSKFGPHVYLEFSQNGPMVGIEHNGTESETFVARYVTDLTNHKDELDKFLGLLHDPNYPNRQ